MTAVQICKIKDTSLLLPCIDPSDADGEFLQAIKENEDIYGIIADEITVGAAQGITGGTAFLYVYIFPEHRRKGYGRVAAALLEKEIVTENTRRVMTCCNTENFAAVRFMQFMGFTRQYESDCMVYSGPGFEPEELEVRPYRDEDYPAAHEFYAEAFHRMRVSTGAFPESVPERPSEGQRRYWSETAGDRLVCMENGTLVGYAHLEGGEIGSVSVKPDCQGRGIGRKFVKYLVNFLLAAGHREVTLYCVVGNTRARKLYDSLGFQPACRNVYAVKEL